MTTSRMENGSLAKNKTKSLNRNNKMKWKNGSEEQVLLHFPLRAHNELETSNFKQNAEF